LKRRNDSREKRNDKLDKRIDRLYQKQTEGNNAAMLRGTESKSHRRHRRPILSTEPYAM
jgi:hypothetical protein